MFCNKYRLLISRGMDNDLDKNEVEMLAIHLRKCSKCRVKEFQFKNLKRLLKMSDKKSFEIKTSPLKKRIMKMLIKSSSFAALFLLILFTAFFGLNKIFNSSMNKKILYSKSNLVNYPLGTIVYYEKKAPNNYSSNYYIPMSTYLYITDIK
jgi:hypothetical protein